MSGVVERTTDDGAFAYREAVPDGEADGAPVLCLHGFPESSYMWQEILPAIAASGRRALALDLPGSGDSPADPPGTWERLVEAVERFAVEIELDRVVLVVHDWGGLIGLRWACDNPGRAVALVISDTGFFPDGKWHGMADGLRTEGTGEQMLEALDRENFGQMLASMANGFSDEAVDHYWRGIGSAGGRATALDMYRSGDFEKLVPYEGELAKLDVPALMLWGADDPFAPVAGAHRFKKEIRDSRIETIEGAGHFVYADAPAQCAATIAAFVGDLTD